MQTRGSVVIAGRYELESELERGRTGIVWCARDLLLGRMVVLEIVHPALAADDGFRARLAEEARRVARLDAPALARLFDTGVHDRVPFLVREHVEGRTLRQRLDADGPAPLEEALAITRSVLDALAAAHDRGVLHLNLGPDDVLLRSDGSIRLTGFATGPAITATRSPTEACALLDPDRVAPEQREGTAADRRADVYAVAGILFELLTGTAPRGRTSARADRADVPRAVDDAIARALASAPEDRFDDARTFMDALSADVPEDVSRRRGVIRTWFAVPAAVVAAAVVIIVGGLWLGRLEVGGPLGIRAAERPAAAPEKPTLAVVRPASAVAFDPLGDGVESSSATPLAVDGDPATSWRSEAYRYPEGGLGKSGVGLVFDLGAARRVEGIRLWTPHAGFGFRVAVGDDPTRLLEALGPETTASPETRLPVAGTGRYVLVWATSTVDAGDGNRVEIAEFRAVIAPDA